MIIPNYRQGSVPEVKDKWYCSYGVNVGNLMFHRYLSPSGWKVCAHYFETKEEAEKTFQTFKDYSFYPSYEEIQRSKDEEFFHKRFFDGR